MKTKLNKEACDYGALEERIFQHSVKKYKGWDCTKSSAYDDIYKHIDFYLENGWSVDVKAHKRINWSDDNVTYKYVWVELRTVKGRKGWIDGEATHIAFSITDSYIIVSREKLRALVKSKLQNNRWRYKDKRPLPYIIYRRENYMDKIVLVPWEDIMKLGIKKIKRDNEFQG